MDQSELLRFIVGVLSDLDIPYFVTGSVASIFYGEPRFTNDIDIVVDLRESQVPDLASRLPSPEFYFEPESARRAIRRAGQCNVIHPRSGLKIDLMVSSRSELDRERFALAHEIQPAPGYSARIAAPEHVILKKLEFYREGGSDKHLRDIAGILEISGGEIDRDLISRWANRLELDDVWSLFDITE